MRNEKRSYKEWQELCYQIKNQTGEIDIRETPKAKNKRIEKLKKNFEAFCQYYFPHYCKSDFGWFHKKAAKEIEKDKKIFAVLEWPREHAKSVFADVFLPLYLKAKGELTGMILVSATKEKAAGLLGDIQAELVSNLRYINDFGEQISHGDWQDGNFSTRDGLGFWAFGRGQSPRGARKAANRPNLAVVDDIDDKKIVKNLQRVREATQWVLEDLLGCLSISGGRMVAVGNRIHPQGILAHLVGDTDPDKPVKEGITHIKVFATEKGRWHKKAYIDDPGARPAWKENHTIQNLKDRIRLMGHIAAMREFYHEHHEDGLVFQDSWIKWVEIQEIKAYDRIVDYCDPSFKATGDYKAIIMVGRKGKYYDVLSAWVRRDKVSAMVGRFYEDHARLGNKARYYMEANMIQDMLLQEFDEQAEVRGYHVPLRPDKQKKDNKELRIENLSPLIERGVIRFNIQERGSPDMQRLIAQLIGFGTGANDDGPDALEGAISKLGKAKKKGKSTRHSGNYNYSNRKY